MKVGIVGYRKFTNYTLFLSLLLSCNLDITHIISGGADGTDSLAKQFHTETGINITEHNAKWSEYGNRAGPIRNTLIVKDSEVIVAYIHEESKGTIDTIKKGLKSGKEVIVFDITDEKNPIRIDKVREKWGG